MVLNSVEEIFIGLEYNKESICQAKIVCLLHDVGAFLGKVLEAIKTHKI